MPDVLGAVFNECKKCIQKEGKISPWVRRVEVSSGGAMAQLSVERALECMHQGGIMQDGLGTEDLALLDLGQLQYPFTAQDGQTRDGQTRDGQAPGSGSWYQKRD